MEKQVLNNLPHDLLWKDKPKQCYEIILFTLGAILGILGLLIAYYFATSLEYPNYFAIVFWGVPLIVFSISLIRTTLRWGTLFVYKDRIEMYSIFKCRTRVISYSDIIGWSEKMRTLKYDKSDEHLILTIYSSSTSIQIRSDLYKSYPDLKNFIGLADDSTIQKPASILELLSWAISLLLGIGLLSMAAYKYQALEEKLSPDNIVKIKGTISNKLKISEGQYGSMSLAFRLNEFPDHSFETGTPFVRIIEENHILKEIHTGDTIILGMSKEEYHQRILKDITIPLDDRIGYSNALTYYTVSTSTKSYLSLDEYNEENSGYKKRYMYLGIIGGVLCIFFAIKDKPKSKEVKNPIIPR